MRILSKACEYAVRASLFVGVTQEEAGYVPIHRISSELDIPRHFLAKVLKTLTYHNITTSHPGPKGGISLARPASEITVMELIRAIDPECCDTQCVLGLRGCGEEAPCPLHDEWKKTRGVSFIPSQYAQWKLKS